MSLTIDIIIDKDQNIDSINDIVSLYLNSKVNYVDHILIEIVSIYLSFRNTKNT